MHDPTGPAVVVRHAREIILSVPCQHPIHPLQPTSGLARLGACLARVQCRDGRLHGNGMVSLSVYTRSRCAVLSSLALYVSC
jgi:hypothetical protein